MTAFVVHNVAPLSVSFAYAQQACSLWLLNAFRKIQDFFPMKIGTGHFVVIIDLHIVPPVLRSFNKQKSPTSL